jgi:hypothetical protein
MGGVATVAGIAGEERTIAQVFAVGTAIRTNPASIAEPGHANALAARKSADTGAHFHDAADDLMSRYDGQFGMRQFAVDDVQIGTAHPARRDLDQDFTGRRLRHRPLTQHQRRARSVQNHYAHGCHVAASCQGGHSLSISA